MSHGTVAVATALARASLVVADGSAGTAPGRWDPPWLALLVGVAVVLVLTAVTWWLVLIVRVQDTWRDDSRSRRRR